ncbi:MAG: hypothetical protein ACXU86_10475, partial [Archangium sp.]
RMKTPHRAPTSQEASQQETRKPLPGAPGTCVVLWAVGQLACTGPGAQVRPLTPADCPKGAQKAMEEHGISGHESVIVPVVGGAQPVTVHPGYGASVRLIRRWGGAPPGTVLTGELVFGKERVYGRLTEARTPEGKWFPICAQLVDEDDDQLGLKIMSRPGPDTAVVFSTQVVRAVEE